MAFRTNAAPYQRSKRSTLRIMEVLTAALAIVWIAAIIYSFSLDKLASPVKGISYGVRAILVVIVSLVATLATDVVTTLIRHKKDGKESLKNEIVHNLIHNYSYVTALIYALTLPVYTSLYVVAVGAIFATALVKNVFGGFGKNIFNPAIMGRIFVGFCFASSLAVPTELASVGAGVDATSGATLTTAFNNQAGWLNTTYATATNTVFGAIFSDYTLGDLLLGKYVGAMGETFTLLIFVIGIVLSILKVINWRTPVFYLGTVAVSSLVIALVLGLDSPFSYVLYHLSLGGLMFGAIFMITDPVTGPTSPFGKCLIGAFAGLMTVLIRVKGGYPEGVMYSIALCNFISPAIDHLCAGKTSSHLVRKSVVAFGTVLVAIGLCTGVSYSANGGKEVYEVDGMDIVAYNIKVAEEEAKAQAFAAIKENLGFTEDQELLAAAGYTIKTDKVSAVYYVSDGTNNIATVYVVSETGSAKADGYPIGEFTAVAYVAIDNNGKLMSVAFDKAAEIGIKLDFSEYITNNFVGKDGSGIDEVDNMSGATYSSPVVKALISDAFAEYNA